MTRTLLVGGLTVWLPLGGLLAQDAAPATKPIDIEARKASIANLETHIRQREQRLSEWAAEIQQLDQRIASRVDELVKLLAGVRDSQESRNEVTQLKKDAIAALRHGIDLYLSKRKEVRELARTGDTAAVGDLDKFDKRVIKSIDQITELTKSMPTHKDVDKYESSGSSYWNGYYYENSRVAEDWKQNRRDTNASNQQRETTVDALKEALKRLDQRRRTLNDLLANRKLNASERELYTSELGQADAYEGHLKAQLAAVTTATGTSGEAIGREQAHDISQLIEDSRKDIREDASRMFRLYDDFLRGRAQVVALKANLEARKQWLEKNADKPAP